MENFATTIAKEILKLLL